jgi:hypothetical protein
MSLIKIQSGTKVKIEDKTIFEVSSNSPAPILNYTEIPLVVGSQNLGNVGTTTNFPLLPSLTVTLPYTVPSGLFKGLRFTTTPTLPTDILCASSAGSGDIFGVQINGTGSFTAYRVSSAGVLTINRTAVSTMPIINPNTNISIMVNSNSTWRVWYKWNDGFWSA